LRTGTLGFERFCGRIASTRTSASHTRFPAPEREVQLLVASEEILPGSGDAVSVVIPAYNEEHNVRAIFERIEGCLPAGELLEIVFVDDGSSDGTARAVRELRAGSRKVRLVRFGRNFGHQAALLAGLEAARGAAVITLDCDLQHPPELLPRMVEAWRSGAPVVQTVRVQTRGAGPFKRITSSLFYRFINLVSEAPVAKGAADYRLLDRRVVNALLQFRDRQPFLRGLVAWLGFPSVQLEYEAPPRSAGKSGYSLAKMLRLSVQAVTGLSSKPLRLSFYLGLVAACGCLAYGIYAVVQFVGGRTVQGWTSMMVVLTFLGAVQLVSVGVLGEYVGRIFEQTRGMPGFVVVESDPPSGGGGQQEDGGVFQQE
jgi:dolichol-phosphate mannosyltransferase